MEFRYSNRNEGENYSAWLDRVLQYMVDHNSEYKDLCRVGNLEYVASYIESLCENPHYDLIIDIQPKWNVAFIGFVFPIDKLDYKRAKACHDRDKKRLIPEGCGCCVQTISQWLWYMTHEQVESRYNFFIFDKDNWSYRRNAAHNLIRIARVSDVNKGKC